MLDTFVKEAAPVSEYAIIVNPNDNVAIVKVEVPFGLPIVLPNGRIISVISKVPPGHRFATSEIPAGEFVIQYGQPIGTSLGIKQGEWVTHDNMSDDVPVVRELPEDLHTPVPDYIELEE